MITSTQIYWLLMLDGIKDYIGFTSIFIGFAAVIALIVGILLTANAADCDTSIKKWWIGAPIGMFILSSLILLGGALTPNTKQMAIILVAPKIVNNEQVQKFPNQLMVLANEWLEELRPEGATNDATIAN